MSNKPFIIGISGKIGSGKNYLADRLKEELTKKGYNVSENSFAAPLKDELSHIINDIKIHKFNAQQLGNKHNFSEEEAEQLITYLLNTDENTTGYTKNQAVRDSLQYLGTDIRRKQNDKYWVELFDKTLINQDDDQSNQLVLIPILTIPDTRFPNEADYVREEKGFLFRLEVPEEIILARANERDKIRYSEMAKNHLSEIALDDYEHFDAIVGESFNIEELTQQVIDRINQSK